jgi:hypothetical protein
VGTTSRSAYPADVTKKSGVPVDAVGVVVGNPYDIGEVSTQAHVDLLG